MSQVPSLVAVVDDEDAVRSDLIRLLRSASYEATEYQSGARFLESLDTRYPDCVVLERLTARCYGACDGSSLCQPVSAIQCFK